MKCQVLPVHLHGADTPGRHLVRCHRRQVAIHTGREERQETYEGRASSSARVSLGIARLSLVRARLSLVFMFKEFPRRPHPFEHKRRQSLLVPELQIGALKRATHSSLAASPCSHRI
jgi:hypothetical protein